MKSKTAINKPSRKNFKVLSKRAERCWWVTVTLHAIVMLLILGVCGIAYWTEFKFKDKDLLLDLPLQDFRRASKFIQTHWTKVFV